MMDIKMLKYAPSHLVATAVFIALRTKKDPAGWKARLAHHTGFVEADLHACVRDMSRLMAPCALHAACTAVSGKYHQDVYSKYGHRFWRHGTSDRETARWFR